MPPEVLLRNRAATVVLLAMLVPYGVSATLLADVLMAEAERIRLEAEPFQMSLDTPRIIPGGTAMLSQPITPTDRIGGSSRERPRPRYIPPER